MTITYSASAAAELADVARATVYTWCRMGAVAARKAGRRWVIDAVSLAHRISLGIRRTRQENTMTKPAPLSRDAYETECATHGWRTTSDNHLHGMEQARLFEGDLDAHATLKRRRALTVIEEKHQGTWVPNPTPPATPTVACHYCGVPITRRDGECEDCGSQTTVAKWLA